MRAVAREAGVGIATLYRHFPTREALVEAVYKDQVHRLTQGAGELLLRLPPSDALRAWMDLFGNWLATMHGMIDSGEIAHTETRDELLAAIAGILDAGKAAGDLRSDVAADDIAASVIGMFTVTSGQGGRTGLLLDLLVDGLRPQGRQK